jgi:hypothetical protein
MTQSSNGRTPKAICRDGEWWILIDAYEWANLIKRNEEPKIKEPDRELKYELIRLKNSIQKIIKMIE